ncbi:MAG TPA: hypothetical protein VJT49_08320 [Amycolatopsis sp.]|uniref:hypothetical protein n=1 Tax=Amycolatopsis sp. TaxID=37632 RepID=UPI002B495D0B|nr:hypothetical protein [Amycolatopsis sp.]HKS45105.1 hypothetical protein [Amycolatopsis sp.]
MQSTEWQRVENPDFGYAVRIPRGWDERPPNLKNSPWETVRFGDPADRRHSVIVFRQAVRPGRSALELAELVQPSLESAGFTDFEITESGLGGKSGALLRCARHDAGRTWAVSEYIVVEGKVSFCLGCGTSIPDEDETLFARMAEGFELIG